MTGVIASTAATHNGRWFLIELRPDPLKTPYDDNPADFAVTDLAAWQHDWQYVIVSVIPFVNGWPIPEATHEETGVRFGDAVAVTVTLDDIARQAVEEGWCLAALQNITADQGRAA